MPSGEIGWRGSRRSSWQEERGGAGGDGEESPLAGKDYRQKSLPKGRLSLTVMLRLFNSATFYLIHIFNPLIPCLFMPDLDLIGPFKDFLGLLLTFLRPIQGL